jgi:hypothetical protein
LDVDVQVMESRHLRIVPGDRRAFELSIASNVRRIALPLRHARRLPAKALRKSTPKALLAAALTFHSSSFWSVTAKSCCSAQMHTNLVAGC